ncbi:hypothetical protein ACRYJU_04690 [Alloalcanivorax xenomutans]|uniref:CcgAII protein n=1 Tax=Alcanivorax xiamenensis TaxID=1177156 RepID=A0ABQ6Y5A2_9GAMM|nr:hypothetical protein [Alcanivorax xiamenensis]KAF0804376.1 hypothetical protein A6D6_03113 [Alcanivorax xiamenensis]
MFDSNSDSTHLTTPAAIAAQLQHLAREATQCSGSSYEIYQDLFSGSVDALLEAIEDPAVKAAILDAAREHGDYVTRDELEAMREAWMDTGDCYHGFDPNCCPLGCGDLPEFAP